MGTLGCFPRLERRVWSNPALNQGLGGAGEVQGGEKLIKVEEDTLLQGVPQLGALRHLLEPSTHQRQNRKGLLPPKPSAGYINTLKKEE